ncbi:hypothetical protein L9F63_008599, partial [Diploptera punctata]
PNFGAKDELNSTLGQDIQTEDCRFNNERREYVDMTPASVICTTSSCVYQGYQQYTMADCHINRSAS